MNAFEEYGGVFDRMLGQIRVTAKPVPVCIDCGRPMEERGLCDDCRADREQDEIDEARARKNY